MTKIGEQQLIKAAQEAADIASTYIEPVTRSDIIRWGPVVKLNNFDPRYHPKEYVPMDDDRSFIEATNKQIDNYFHLGEDGVMEDTTVATDNVNKPDHYNTGAVECIDYLRDNMPRDAFEGYLEGCAKKYMHRWRYKGVPLQDLKKAKWYLERLISEVDLWEDDD